MTSSFANKLKNGRRKRYFYYRCSVTCKHTANSCSLRYVSADRLDQYLLQNLSSIAANPQYLESLAFTLNFGRKGVMAGVEPSDKNCFFDANRIREIIDEVVGAAKLDGPAEREAAIKKYIQTVVYSKETIEVTLKYLAAACFCPHPKTSRGYNSPIEKIARENPKIAVVKV